MSHIKLRLHEEAVMKMLRFACTIRNGKEQFREVTKYLRRLWYKSYCTDKIKCIFFFVSWDAFHSSHVKSGGVQLCSEEDNVVTSIVLTSSIFMNQETPNERRGD